MTRVLSYASDVTRPWHQYPAVWVALVLNALALAWNVILFVMLSNDNGYARLATLVFAGVGLVGEVLVTLIPVIIICAKEKFSRRVGGTLQWITTLNLLAPLAVGVLALLLPNSGGC